MIEKEILKQKLSEGKSKKQIAKELKTSIVTLKKYIGVYNLEEFYSYDKGQDLQKRRSSVDLEFFEKIDTEEKAYIFGLLLSDGYLIKDRVIGFTLQEADKEILFKIKDVMKSKHKVSLRKRESTQDCYRFDITSSKLVLDLNLLGVTVNKSFEAFIPFDKIPDSLIRHVIRGIFDGDGSFSRNQPCIATSSIRLKNDIIDWCVKNYSYSPYITKQNNNFRIYFRKAGFPILCDVYLNSKIHIQREMNSFQEYYKYRIKNQ